MELLKLVQQNRMEKAAHRPIPHAMDALPTPKAGMTRPTIIEKKPKPKALKEYFEDFVREAIEEEEAK